MKRPPKFFKVTTPRFEYICKVHCNGRYKVVWYKFNNGWIPHKTPTNKFISRTPIHDTNQISIPYWRDIHKAWAYHPDAWSEVKIIEVTEKDLFTDFL